MKFKKRKSSINSRIIVLFTTSILFTASTPSFAVPANNAKKTIYVTSDSQSLDMRNNVVTFVGNVNVIQGTVKIKAEKVVITRSHKEHGREIIDSYGDPVTFCRTQDNYETIKGYASRIHYELEKNFIVLNGNACINQRSSNISGDKITYLLKEKKIEAFSKKGNRVTVVLMPKYLQDQYKTRSLWKENH